MHGIAALLRQACTLAVLRRPRSAAAPLRAEGFILVAVIVLAAHCVNDYALADPPRELNRWALADYSLFLLLALLLGAAGARLVGRPALALRPAALMLLATLPAQLAIGWVESRWAWLDTTRSDRATLLAMLHGTGVLLQLFGWIGGGLTRRAVGAAGLAAATLLAALHAQMPDPWWWTEQDDEEDVAAATPPSFDSEAVIYAQPARVEQAVAALAPQRPGIIDLYAVGFGGDGAEPVFRNEVEYFATLMERRFGAKGRIVRLINHPDTLERDPLATLHNLRLALAGVAARMDRDQDILLLFMTSHGSADHALRVALDPLPLHQITPRDLRAALDDAGIRWRVLVVSACYSGGFIDALESPETLVITASRADRPSFGCGVQSELTWFGEALLTEALNETGDFAQAFAIAKRNVRERERIEDERPSHPQLEAGATIGDQLHRWREQTTLGRAVPFEAAVPASGSDSE